MVDGIGITDDYTYETVFADPAFEDAFFGHLTSIALGPIPGGTFYQQACSAHPLAAQHIPASYLIDATEAERWLGGQRRRPGAPAPEAPGGSLTARSHGPHNLLVH